MSAPVKQIVLFFAGLAIAVLLWLGVLGFLAQDACLDGGGSLSGPWFGCLLPNGNVQPWFAMLRPSLSLGVGAAVAFPVAVVTRHFIRSVEGSA